MILGIARSQPVTADTRLDLRLDWHDYLAFLGLGCFLWLAQNRASSGYRTARGIFKPWVPLPTSERLYSRSNAFEPQDKK